MAMDILFDRSVKLEVEEDQIFTHVYKAIPRLWESDDPEEQRLSTLDLDAAPARHEVEVEAPAREAAAAAAVASRTTTTSGWRKEPVTFAAADAGYYRKLLAGIEPVLPPQIAAAPAVNSLTLRVSWLPSGFAATGLIASAHDSLLALCVGSYRAYKGYSSWRERDLLGCYLVLDTRAESVAVVPPLPHGWGRFADDDSESKHSPMGPAGVAVLRTAAHDAGAGAGAGYLLAELYRHTGQDGFPTNRGSLFTWCSPGSGGGAGAGAGADQWIRKEVVLPFPDPDEEEFPYFFGFCPGTVFAVSSTALCWVDVWAGILICDNITSSTDAGAGAGADGDDDGLVFRFIPLPEECAPESDATTEYRSACCVDSDTFRLLCMDDGGGEETLAITTWTLIRSPLSTTDGWRWEKDEDASCAALCLADLLDDAIPPADGAGGSKRRLLRRVVRSPVVGRARPGVAHVCVHELEFKRREKAWEAAGCYQVSLDVARRSVASVFAFPAGSSARGDMVMAL